MSGSTIESFSNRILSIAIDVWNERISGSLASREGFVASEGELEGFLGEMQLLFPAGVVRAGVVRRFQANFGGVGQGAVDWLGVFGWLLKEVGLIDASGGYLEGGHVGDGGGLAGGAGVLRESLHRAISLLSSSESVACAIEGSARRQIYQMAYGLTHEINNPLGNIAARAQLLLSQATEPMDRKALGTIVDQAMRAHEMLAELMRVVQPREVSVASVDLRGLVRGQFDRMESMAGEKKLGWEWSELQERGSYLAKVNEQGVMEAVRLVAQNSIEACRHRDSIRWRVERRGEWIRIGIRDTGPGVGVETARRVFDLYFSGREAGRGLGVSLAAVRRFVEESGGRLGWESEVGLGTEVTMEFPASS